MSREVHVRFSESLRGRFPRATRLTIFCTDAEEATRAWETLETELEKLKLALNFVKSNIVDMETEDLSYLGYCIGIRTLKLKKIDLKKIRSKIRRKAKITGIDPDPDFRVLNDYLRGFREYYKYIDLDELESLDAQIANRVRRATRNHYTRLENVESWHDLDKDWDRTYQEVLSTIVSLQEKHRNIELDVSITPIPRNEPNEEDWSQYSVTSENIC